MILGVKSLSPEDAQLLKDLNLTVENAIRIRREWLDAKMEEISPLKPGDEVYDVDSGQCLGLVGSLYRFWRDRDDGIRDRNLDVQFTYGNGNNTSSQYSVVFGTKAEAIRQAKMRLEILDSPEVES